MSSKKDRPENNQFVLTLMAYADTVCVNSDDEDSDCVDEYAYVVLDNLDKRLNNEGSLALAIIKACKEQHPEVAGGSFSISDLQIDSPFGSQNFNSGDLGIYTSDYTSVETYFENYSKYGDNWIRFTLAKGFYANRAFRDDQYFQEYKDSVLKKQS